MRQAVSRALHWLANRAMDYLPWCPDNTPPRLFFWLEDAADFIQGDGPGPFSRGPHTPLWDDPTEEPY